MDWLWHGLVTNAVYALVILAGGIVIAILRKKGSAWASPTLYGLGGSATIAILIFAFTGHAILSRQQPETTSENVEANIKAWVDEFKLGILRQDDPQMVFEYVITLHNGTFVYVARGKDTGRYLRFMEQLNITPADRTLIASLSPNQQKQIHEELELAAARQKIGYAIQGTPGPPPQVTAILLLKSVPIGAGLTDTSFSEYLDEMDNANVACRDALRLAIERFKPLPD